MKIPTKQHNTKHNFLAIGALAAVIGLSAPTAVLAHGGGGDKDRSSDKTSHWQKDRKKHDSKYGHWGGWHDQWSWYGAISPEKFSKKNTELLERYDKFIAKNNLDVENGDNLKADVETSASVVVNELTALQELRKPGDKLQDSTTEQRSALKEQLKKVASAQLDYKFALYEYKLAIKAAADEAKVDARSTIKLEE